MLEYDSELPLDKKISQHRRLTYDILDGMVDWVRVMNREGSVIFANKSMKKAQGQELLGMKCYTMFEKNSRCVRCIGDTTINTGEAAEKEEKIGDKIFSIKSSPVKDLNGYIYAVVEVFRDVTRERKLERDIMEQNYKMSKDVDFAKKIQMSILPKKGIFGPLKIDYLYRPSETLSGDMFDLYQIDEDHIGIYISDVVGHGVSASIMTMFIRQTMEHIMKHTLSPSDAISSLHKSFLDLNLDDENYFTILYGIINTKDRTMMYSNGGHNSLPIVVSREQNKRKAKCLEASGYPITYLFESVDYKEHTVQLKRDDEILFLTDGVLECKNLNSELFGEQRLVDAIERAQTDTIESIESSINEFIEEDLEAEDDVTILRLEFIE